MASNETILPKVRKQIGTISNLGRALSVNWTLRKNEKGGVSQILNKPVKTVESASFMVENGRQWG